MTVNFKTSICAEDLMVPTICPPFHKIEILSDLLPLIRLDIQCLQIGIDEIEQTRERLALINTMSL